MSEPVNTNVLGPNQVTIGLMSMNEEETIERSIGALLDNLRLLGSEAELIVIAGGQDRTVEIARRMLSGNDQALLLEDSKPKGKPAALNRLFKTAKGSIVILSDGDVVVGDGSVKRLVDAFADPEIGCASGRVMGASDDYTPVMQACDFMNRIMHLSREEQWRTRGTVDLASGYLIGIRRELLRAIPPEFTSDDGYLSNLARHQGYRIAYVPEATVTINFPRYMTDFLKQKMRTRYGHVQLAGHFKIARSRNVLTEVRDFVRLSGMVRAETRHGAWIESLAIGLTLMAWGNVYMRRVLPFTNRKPVWQPVRSTKRHSSNTHSVAEPDADDARDE